VAIALQAIAEAKARGIRVEYQVTSRGPELEHLKKLARNLGISDQVILGERFEAEDFAEALGTFDICLVPSLRDGAGLSIMEAMLAGCVPIVADWCGPAEFVTEDCGFKVPVTNPKRMAQDLADILCLLDSDRDFQDWADGKIHCGGLQLDFVLAGERKLVFSLNLNFEPVAYELAAWGANFRVGN
jgi:glycosyltransferase involved in cell wall biosynthesis